MPHPIRLAINGASGRMGRALLALVREDKRFELVNALVSANSEHNGTPVFAELPTSLQTAALSVPLRKLDHARLVSAVNTRLIDAMAWS